VKVAINTRLLLHGKLEGIGWFSYEILKRVVLNNPNVTFYFLFDRPYNREFIFAENVVPVVLFPPARHPFLFKIWFNIAVKRALKKIKPDVFISPDGFLSLTTKVPQINVIHDINFEHYPNAMPLAYLSYYKSFFPKFAKLAKHIITVSEYSKQDIAKTYSIPLEKISVVYNAPAEMYHPISDEEQNEVRNKYTNGNPYFVYVGSIHQRKNPVNMLLAFEHFKSTSNYSIKLVIVGNKMWKYPEFENVYSSMKYKDDVVFTGHVQREELNSLLASARALLFLSYFEGFGIPLVEAMKTRTAILTTKLTAMPEVCNDAALYCNPFDVNDISEKMQQLAQSDKLVNELIEKGSERVKDFSWDVSAQKFWSIIEQQINA
jgi:glycosyltransferase involved in cell wall biosynthesis